MPFSLIPNFTGPLAGQSFRNAINALFGGSSASTPQIVGGTVDGTVLGSVNPPTGTLGAMAGVTPGSGDRSTNLATTAFLGQYFNPNGSDGTNVVAPTGATTLTAAQSGSRVIPAFSAAATITLPSSLLAGLNYRIYGSGTVVVTISSGSTTMYFPDGSNAKSFALPVNYGSGLDLVCDGSAWRALPFGPTLASTLGVSGLLTPSGGIAGITNGANSAAGTIGEIISSIVTESGAVSLTSEPTGDTGQNITSVSLTPGFWLAFGEIWSNSTPTAVTFFSGTIGTTSKTAQSNPAVNGSSFYYYNSSPQFIAPFAPALINVSSNTSVYLIAQCEFTGSMSAYGKLVAVRIH